MADQNAALSERQFRVEIRTTGWAVITAGTKAEAIRKAQRGEWSDVRHLPWTALTSKIEEVR